MRILIINHTFQKEQFSKRWKLMAETHKEWDITLIAPNEYTWGNTFGFIDKNTGYTYSADNYHVHQISIRKPIGLGLSWTSKELISIIAREKPDIVYHIGGLVPEALVQILMFKKHRRKDLKVYTFSMRGPTSDAANLLKLSKQDKNIIKKILRYPEYVYEKAKVRLLNSQCDAVFCHYPQGMDCFRKEGYLGPIFMQTQVGVDTDVFYKDRAKRETIREKYKLGNSFVFASAVRFIPGKGISQILDAMPIDGDWKYMLIGSGLPEEISKTKRKIEERGLESNVILTGYIEWEEMAYYWNAADCAIHFPQTTSTWVETFSLAVVQAMAVGLPVIGSSSGSVPYQVGPDGIIVEEDDISGLHAKLQWAIDNREETIIIGKKLMKRAVESFGIYHLNNLFYETVTELQKGVYDKSKVDMANSNIV